MTTRHISIKDLDSAVINLNALFGYTEGQHGSFCLQGAYGGWQLQRRIGTGIVSVTDGYLPKRELLNLMGAMQTGATLMMHSPRIREGQGATN